MKDGFLKVACVAPNVIPADCIHNVKQIFVAATNSAADVICFPELCVTGYTCGDLFLQNKLLESAKESLLFLTERTQRMKKIMIVGFPMSYRDKLYNCAAVLYDGKILGIVPKTCIPNYNEFYEMRHFTSGKGIDTDVLIGGHLAHFGTNQIFCCDEMPLFRFGIEICEDLWVNILIEINTLCIVRTVQTQR